LKEPKISLARILDLTEPLVDHIPKKCTQEEVLYYAYFLSLLELAREIQRLDKAKLYRSLSIVTRSFIETFVNLKLIANDISHANSLILEANKKERKKINSVLQDELLDDQRELLQGVYDSLTTEISDRKELIDPTKKVNTILDKFIKVDMEWFYDTFYNELCDLTHNSIKSIEKNHIKMTDDSKIIFKFHAPNFESQAKVYLLLASNYLVEGLSIIDEKCELACKDMLDQIEREA
jgi:hypothetical protein